MQFSSLDLKFGMDVVHKKIKGLDKDGTQRMTREIWPSVAICVRYFAAWCLMCYAQFSLIGFHEIQLVKILATREHVILFFLLRKMAEWKRGGTTEEKEGKL